MCGTGSRVAVIPKKDGLLPGWGRPGKPRGRVGFCAGLQRKAQDLAGQRRTRNDIRIREEVLAMFMENLIGTTFVLVLRKQTVM